MLVAVNMTLRLIAVTLLCVFLSAGHLKNLQNGVVCSHSRSQKYD